MPKRTESETALLAKVHQYLAHVPVCYWEKRHGGDFGASGQPDVHGVIAGKSFQVELKALDKRPTKLQQAQLRRWGDAGATTGWARTLGEFHNIVRHLLPMVTCQACHYSEWLADRLALDDATVRSLWSCSHCGQLLTKPVPRERR